MEVKNANAKTMRDALIGEIYNRMQQDERIFFLSADMGAPVLDKLRQDFQDRFINVGIAEQNLINVATGLALEGYAVYAYAIAPFFLRAYEQIRINLALSTQFRDLNVNFMGVGAGVSYDVSGPTHQCLEDLSAFRTLPNLVLFSPSDWRSARRFVDYSLTVRRPKYVRLDGKPLPPIYDEQADLNWDEGCCELVQGQEIALVSTGYMTHKALKVAELLRPEGTEVGVIDVFLLAPLGEDALLAALAKYRCIVTLEEGFVGKGGLDSLILSLFAQRGVAKTVKSMGFDGEYRFESRPRDVLHAAAGFGEEDILRAVRECQGSL